MYTVSQLALGLSFLMHASRCDARQLQCRPTGRGNQETALEKCGAAESEEDCAGVWWNAVFLGQGCWNSIGDCCSWGPPPEVCCKPGTCLSRKGNYKLFSPAWWQSWFDGSVYSFPYKCEKNTDSCTSNATMEVIGDYINLKECPVDPVPEDFYGDIPKPAMGLMLAIGKLIKEKTKRHEDEVFFPPGTHSLKDYKDDIMELDAWKGLPQKQWLVDDTPEFTIKTKISRAGCEKCGAVLTFAENDSTTTTTTPFAENGGHNAVAVVIRGTVHNIPDWMHNFEGKSVSQSVFRNGYSVSDFIEFFMKSKGITLEGEKEQQRISYRDMYEQWNTLEGFVRSRAEMLPEILSGLHAAGLFDSNSEITTVYVCGHSQTAAVANLMALVVKEMLLYRQNENRVRVVIIGLSTPLHVYRKDTDDFTADDYTHYLAHLKELGFRDWSENSDGERRLTESATDDSSISDTVVPTTTTTPKPDFFINICQYDRNDAVVQLKMPGTNPGRVLTKRYTDNFFPELELKPPPGTAGNDGSFADKAVTSVKDFFEIMLRQRINVFAHVAGMLSTPLENSYHGISNHMHHFLIHGL